MQVVISGKNRLLALGFGSIMAVGLSIFVLTQFTATENLIQLKQAQASTEVGHYMNIG